MTEKKSNIWILDVNIESSMKVTFDEEVTLKEAMELFNQQEYEDIIDENHNGMHAVGGNI